MSAIAILFASPFITLGFYCAYCIYRYGRSSAVDGTAAAWSYVSLMWLIASQPEALAEKLGFPGQDLSEALQVTDDDGEIS